MSEATAKSQVRHGEKTDNDPLAPLVSLDEVKAYFGIMDTALDTVLTMAADIVSSVIRGYTGRTLTYGSYTEVFTDVMEPKTERYLIETPIEDFYPANLGGLMNRNTGRVYLVAGQRVDVAYDGGYQVLPPDLMAVTMELIRQQAAFMGHDNLGTAPSALAPIEKAVWLGTLKVEYAVAATSPQSKAAGAGALSADGLAPYAIILDQYRSHRKLAAT
jgi:hypothetical protein